MPHDLNPMLETACQIARDASAVAMGHFRRPLDIQSKADDSPVTIADRQTETAIRAALQSHFPDHGIYGEEFGVQGDTNQPMWVVDPIDGTRSFISGNPLFGMLLSFADQGRALLGVIRMPALDETFAAAQGLGATLNGDPIRSRDTRALDQAILYINEAENIHAADPDRFARLTCAGHTRRMAYDCYPHALVAAGHVDAVVDCGLEPYDYLALAPVIQAAGGIMTDWQGAPLGFGSDGRVVSACTPELHAEVLRLLDA
jgi:histidinol phosphatase-like enzyme (inositol monophosphatase family)